MILFQTDIPYIFNATSQVASNGVKARRIPSLRSRGVAVTWQDLDRASTLGPSSYIDHFRRSDHDFDVALVCDCGVAFEAVFSDGVVSSSWALTSRKW